jgi:hypothetical protein
MSFISLGGKLKQFILICAFLLMSGFAADLKAADAPPATVPAAQAPIDINRLGDSEYQQELIDAGPGGNPYTQDVPPPGNDGLGGGAASGAGKDSVGANADIKECEDAKAAAKTTCTQPGIAGMSSSGAAEAASIALTIGTSMADILAAKTGSSKLCYAAAALQAAQGAMATLKATTCAIKISSCSDSCDTDRKNAMALQKLIRQNNPKDYANDHKYVELGEELASARSMSESCQNYSGINYITMMQTAQLGQAAQKASSCGDLNSSKNNPIAAIPPITIPNVADCASGGTGMACYCTNNPTASICKAQTPNTNPSGLSSIGGGSPSMPYSSSSDGTPGSGTGPGAPITAKPQDTKADSGGGGGGSGLAGGGGSPGGGSGSGDQASAGASGIDKNPIQGVAVGGGGIGTSGMSSAGYGARGGGGNSANNKAGSGMGMFNLKKFLPQRGLAGMSAEAAKDGITGAMGPTIWEKVSSQYKNQQNTLLQGK